MKEKFLKHKTVIISCAVFLLSLFFLCGALFAIFSDKKPMTSKKIRADGVEVDFRVQGLDGTKPDEYTSVRTNDNPLFNYDKWDYGFTAVRKLEIASLDDGPVKYNVKVTVLPIKGQKSTLSLSDLSKQIEVYRFTADTLDELPEITNGDISSLEYLGTLTEVLDKGATVFYDTLSSETGTEDYAIVALRMKPNSEDIYESVAVANCFDLSLYAFDPEE